MGCNNAWEAGSQHVEISARLVPQTLGDEEGEIEVADRGSGFPDVIDDLELVFRPFYTHRESGTGLAWRSAERSLSSKVVALWRVVDQEEERSSSYVSLALILDQKRDSQLSHEINLNRR